MQILKRGDLITIEMEQFIKLFPYFADKGLTEDQLAAASAGVISWVTNIVGNVGLSLERQVRAVYLAAAHLLFLHLNPSAFKGRLTSASEGSVSAGFQAPPITTLFQYPLTFSGFGLELLAILQTVQPLPVPRRTDPQPYYRGTGGFNGIL